MPTALVVDDEEDVRELLAVVLAGAGFGVRTAASGLEALDVLDAGSAPDLIVLDVQMPDLDGWDTLAAIRAHEIASAVPVILCTVRAQPADVERAWTLGCDGFVRKPFAIDELAREALAVIDRPAAERDVIRRDQLAAARSPF